MGSLSTAQLEAAAEFGTAALQAFDQGGSFPAETVIASVARMAGSFLLRSLGLPLAQMPPGSAVLSDEANLQGPRLIQVLGAVLQSLGVRLDPASLSAAQAAAKGPKESFLQTQETLEPRFIAIQDKYDMTEAEAADSAAAATAVLIKNCAALLDPHVGFSLAAYGFIEGSKTVPAMT
jgi:hypothetical protein